MTTQSVGVTVVSIHALLVAFCAQAARPWGADKLWGAASPVGRCWVHGLHRLGGRRHFWARMRDASQEPQQLAISKSAWPTLEVVEDEHLKRWLSHGPEQVKIEASEFISVMARYVTAGPMMRKTRWHFTRTTCGCWRSRSCLGIAGLHTGQGSNEGPSRWAVRDQGVATVCHTLTKMTEGQESEHLRCAPSIRWDFVGPMFASPSLRNRSQGKWSIPIQHSVGCGGRSWATSGRLNSTSTCLRSLRCSLSSASVCGTQTTSTPAAWMWLTAWSLTSLWQRAAQAAKEWIKPCDGWWLWMWPANRWWSPSGPWASGTMQTWFHVVLKSDAKKFAFEVQGDHTENKPIISQGHWKVFAYLSAEKLAVSVTDHRSKLGCHFG